MKILISAHSLDYSGVPTYTLTLNNELKRLGHDVYVYSPGSGPLSEFMKTYTNFEGMETPDVILAQANKCAVWMKGGFPNVPMIFIGHGVLPDLEQPPRIHIDRYIAVNEQVEHLFVRQYVRPGAIDIVRDFIDTEIFKPITPLQEKPRVLFISNFKKWKTYDRLEAACRILGLDFTAIGSPYGKSKNTAEDINNADIVVGKGRCILEGMSCGRVVISYNEQLGDGYLTEKVYKESRERNFGGYECRYAFTAEDLVKELEKYRVENGETNRKIILENHEVKKCVNQIMNIIDLAIKRHE